MKLKLSSLSAEQEIKNKKIGSLEKIIKEKETEIGILKEKLERSS